MTEFYCQFCGKPHTTLESYAQCVLACYKEAQKKKSEEEAAKRRQEQIEREKQENEKRQQREANRQELIKRVRAAQKETEHLTDQLYREYPETMNMDVFGIVRLFDDLLGHGIRWRS